MHIHPNTDAVVVIDPVGEFHIFGESDPARRYAFASVTKILTTHVMVETIISRDMKDKVITHDHFDGPVTFDDILSHASGIRPGGLLPIAPRTKRIYTNEAFETAEVILKQSLHNFSVAHLFDETLGAHLESTIIYEGTCAAGATGTFDDVVKVLKEIRDPTFLHRDVHDALREPYIADLEGIVPGFGFFDKNTWGIGYEVRGNKSHWMGAHSSPQTYGHFGQSGTFVMHDPVNDISIATVSKENFGSWAKDAWPEMCNDIYQQYV